MDGGIYGIIRICLLGLVSIVILVGLTGNAISVFLFTKTDIKRTSFAVLMISLSLGNLCKIVVSYMVNIGFDIMGKQHVAHNDRLCQLTEILDICSSYTVAQSLVYLALIRLAVFTGARNLIARAHNYKQMASALIIGLGFFAVLNVGHVASSYGISNVLTHEGGQTHKICVYRRPISKYIYFSELLLFYSIIPAACMTIFSVVIARVIRRIRNAPRKDPIITKKMQRHHQTNVAFFFLSMLHFVCTLPYICIWLWIAIRPGDFKLNQTPVHIAKFSYYIGVVNHSTNVYLCAFTSKAIRQYIKNFFTTELQSQPSFQITPAQSSTQPEQQIHNFFPSAFNVTLESTQV